MVDGGMSEQRSTHCVISGRVQGVGIRYATQRVARSLGVNGWVRNRPDGSVEALLSGASEKVEQLIEWLRKGPRFAAVDSLVCSEVDPDPAVTGFETRS